MAPDTYDKAVARLGDGPTRSFGLPLDPEIPRVAAGCYTVWNDAGDFIYAGMAGRGMKAEDIAKARAKTPVPIKGLRDRLTAHRRGQRSGDAFAVYVFDRFILGTLSKAAIVEAVSGQRRLDDDVREFIYSNLSYRWVETKSCVEADALENLLVTRGIGGTLPYLNPQQPEES